jgi:hypothetical protein
MLLKRLKRWLGWDSDSGLLSFGDLAGRSPPRPIVPKPAAPSSARPASPPTAGAQNAPERKPKKRNPLDVLDNPSLTLDKPADDGFDPYNTGAFNRSTSWEKIGRQRKR